MTESISQWSFRAAAALFSIFFLGSLWYKSLQVAPTRVDVADRRFEVRMTATYDPPSLVRYGISAIGNRPAPQSIRRADLRVLASHSASPFHLPTPARRPR